MRLATYRRSDGSHSVALVLDDDKALLLDGHRNGAPCDVDDMLAIIEAGDEALTWLGQLATARANLAPVSDLRLAAPIPRPRKNIFCVGWNYLEHFEEGAKTRPAMEIPDRPTFFTKAPTTANGPFDPISGLGKVTAKLDWEAEMAIIIGRRGRDIRESDAMAFVWGYMVLNDITGREVQRRHGNQWFKGKSLDGCAPMGPWITLAERVDPSSLRIACRVNGVTKQESSTQHMYFKIPRLLSELSEGLTLEPGDIIATGTPAGVGHARNPPEFLKAGDVVETEVEGLGLLRNRIVD
ncbi:MAG TPA: fumarylacetoacetate hydrolase family protein [Usitatibacter sp.]|nr:fumarylacetoacetate hydrolase family protein [Usitatibacter sp.]